MSQELIAPFSARNRGAHLQIDSAFPESARTALLYLLHDLLRARYVDTWIDIARELERLTRAKPVDYYKSSGDDLNKARIATEDILYSMAWDSVLDFCERLYEVLLKDGSQTRSYIQSYIARELNRLFVEENLAFEFREGFVQRRGRQHSSTQVSRAQVVLGDPRLESARNHFNKGLRYFHSVSNQDPENAVKEAVCSVEATARALFADVKLKTLGDVIKSITAAEPGKLPKAVANTFHDLYAFRSGGAGVTHGGSTGGVATPAIAEYVLAVAASQIILLVDLANAEEGGVPF